MKTGLFDTEYIIKVFSNKGKTYETSIEDTIECGYHERIEECHGYHTFYDVCDEQYEAMTNEAQEKFESSKDCFSICEDYLCDELEEDEHIIGFTRDLEAKIKKSNSISEWSNNSFLLIDEVTV